MKPLDRRVEANLCRGFVLPADVRRRRGVIPNLDDGDSGWTPVGMALDREFQFLTDGTRVGAAVDQTGRHRLSLLRQIADLDGSRDLDRESAQVGEGRALADAHR